VLSEEYVKEDILREVCGTILGVEECGKILCGNY
jgi:hypothetical protein